MADRITEARLAAIDGNARAFPNGPGSTPLILEFVAEVRRLRALIVGMNGVTVDDTFVGEVGCVHCGDDHERAACPANALQAEIDAIQAESNPHASRREGRCAPII